MKRYSTDVLSILMLNILCTNGFVVQDTYNVLLKDSADYKVDLIINADDYEMIENTQLRDFNIADRKQKFNKIDNLAKAEYNNTLKCTSKSLDGPWPKQTLTPGRRRLISKTNNKHSSDDTVVPIVVVTGKDNHIMTTYMGPLTTHAITKRDATKYSEYDYDYLMNEYYDEVKNDSRNAYPNKSDIPEYGPIYLLKKIFLQRHDNGNCTDLNGIGLQAIKCLVENYQNQSQPAKDVAKRLLRIFQIWFLVYLVVAVPLWCTRGWCCCCLFCKFFKPRQTIEEAKKYVVSYPPGVFKTKNGEVRYEPSEREKDCYEEFEHFIKTL